jgi:hypothetical protein
MRLAQSTFRLSCSKGLLHLSTFLNCYNDAAKFLLESQDSEKIVNLPHIINIGSHQ